MGLSMGSVSLTGGRGYMSVGGGCGLVEWLLLPPAGAGCATIFTGDDPHWSGYKKRVSLSRGLLWWRARVQYSYCSFGVVIILL